MPYEIENPTPQENILTFQNLSAFSSGSIERIVDKMARDMKFFAVVYTIYGVFMCLTILGAIIGVPTIIYNLKLKDAADEYRAFVRNKDFYQLLKAMDNQRKFFLFNKILILIGIVFIILYIGAIFYIFYEGLYTSPFSRSFA